MSAGLVCTRVVHLADAAEPVRAAAARMRERDVGTLLVLDEGRRPVGLVTDRDLALRVLADDLSPETPVGEVMSRPVDAVSEDTGVEDALRFMRERRHRRVAVVDAEGRLVGLLAVDDVLGVLALEMERIGALVGGG